MCEKPAFQKTYTQWLEDPCLLPEDQQQLAAMAATPELLEDAFYRNLEFGTAGLRGKIGLGTNRMNRYTIGMAAQGFADFIRATYPDCAVPKVVIAHDNRRMSREFCLETARVMAANGLTAYIYEDLRATPELSFGVRYLQAQGGVVITASHNPPEYNGFKVYGEDGAQLVPELADLVTEKVEAVAAKGLSAIVQMEEAHAFRAGLIQVLGKEVDEAYQQAVIATLQHPELIRKAGDNLRALFTPLHGTGGRPVVEVLAKLGVAHLQTVPEQMIPDTEFSTAKQPNPEDFAAFKLAMQQAADTDLELIVATDPDADRVGLVVKNAKGDWIPLTGNQTGALLTDYVLTHYRRPEDAVVISTIVTSGVAGAICRAHGVSYEETLTGFKFIGERIRAFEAAGRVDRFAFGFEESYGYLLGTHARDKDAVVTTALIFEMVAYYQEQGIRLDEALEALYRRYGFYHESVKSIQMEGKEGLAQIKALMTRFRQEAPEALANVRCVQVVDYAQAGTGLRPSDVVKYIFEEGSWVAMRPSGTEPKLKIYCSVKGETGEEARERAESFMKALEPMLTL